MTETCVVGLFLYYLYANQTKTKLTLPLFEWKIIVMKIRLSRFIPILLIALAATLPTGCAPMVYDDNPHFSHHRYPPKPVQKPKPIPKPKPKPKPTPSKPAPAPTPGRPGTNNHR